MSDQLTLLQRGIPTEVVVLLIVITVATLAAVFAALRGSGGEKVLRIAAGVLSGLGLLVSGYVVYKTQVLNEVPQCISGGGGCSLVEKSDYSHLGGVHVSIFGFIGYALLLGASIWNGDRARVAGFVLALFGFGFSLYLTYLELWEILAICQWCVTSAVVMTMLFVVNTTRMFSYFGLDEYEDDVAEPVDEAPET
ncbi:MAG: vitamin K epoxide reductase family protein [Thermoleophilia bacterium]|nr:vitamin K epoxide reductase family protein [Thermoleophilia bacterium]